MNGRHVGAASENATFAAYDPSTTADPTAYVSRTYALKGDDAVSLAALESNLRHFYRSAHALRVGSGIVGFDPVVTVRGTAHAHSIMEALDYEVVDAGIEPPARGRHKGPVMFTDADFGMEEGV